MTRPEQGVSLTLLNTLLNKATETTPVPVTWEWMVAQACRLGARWGVTPADFERVRRLTVEELFLAMSDPRKNWPSW